MTPPALLGPYEILAPIGAGGMGEVFRARDRRLERMVAIKVLREGRDEPDMVERLTREARIVGSLNHPNIVAVYDVGTHEGAPYVVTELLEGETLRERLASGPLPLRKTLELAEQVARGVAAAHDRGVCHRDLKPENLFLTRDGHVKVLDFGLAKQESRARSDSSTASALATPDTEAGVVMGTVGYMAPEQVQGHAADSRSDVFSFG